MPLFFNSKGNSKTVWNYIIDLFSIFSTSKSFICFLPCICFLLPSLHTCSISLSSGWHAENNHKLSPVTAAISLNPLAPLSECLHNMPAPNFSFKALQLHQQCTKTHPSGIFLCSTAFTFYLPFPFPAVLLGIAPTQLQFPQILHTQTPLSHLDLNRGPHSTWHISRFGMQSKEVELNKKSPCSGNW